MFAYLPALGDDDGFAVVTEHFVCLLGSDATLALARELFLALDGPEAAREHALSLLGPAAERFAVVELLDPAERSLSVAVRGQLSMGIEGETASRLSGAHEVTTVARGVSGLWLSLETDAPTGELLPIRRGVVRTRGIAADSLFDRPPVQSEAVEDDAAGTLRVELGGDDEHWILRLPDGNELDADGTIVIGRTTWEPEDGDEPIRRVSVPSPMRQISGSHLELALVDGELVARDLDSTNGTIILTPEHPPRLLHGGSTMSLQTGDILDLGESFRIVVSSKH